MNVNLSYSYDLLYDIKTTEQLQAEVEYLAHRLSGLARLCRDDGHTIDAYVLEILSFPRASDAEGNTLREQEKT